MTDYYQTLGIPSTASAEQIRTAYRECAKHFHPDLHRNSVFFKQRFQDVQHAYEVLSKPESRKAFDHAQSNGKSEYDITISQLKGEVEKLKSHLAQNQQALKSKEAELTKAKAIIQDMTTSQTTPSGQLKSKAKPILPPNALLRTPYTLAEIHRGFGIGVAILFALVAGLYFTAWLFHW